MIMIRSTARWIGYAVLIALFFGVWLLLFLLDPNIQRGGDAGVIGLITAWVLPFILLFIGLKSVMFTNWRVLRRADDFVYVAVGLVPTANLLFYLLLVWVFPWLGSGIPMVVMLSFTALTMWLFDRKQNRNPLELGE